MRKNIHLLKDNTQLKALYTMIRDKETKRDDFVFFSERIIRLLVEYALSLLPVVPKTVKTPAGATYKGVVFKGGVCAVSVVRAGEAMEKVVRDVCPNIRLGKILIQRDEHTAEPKLFYAKLPQDISKRYVLLIDPMMATGGSLCMAIDTLKKHGVKDDKIIFINLITCPQGINKVAKRFPKVHIVTGAIDKTLNSKAFIMPGLGDFGDRYFGTN
ncbi:uracil phosphoribosyltransferase [Candidatus Woesearchaeota archaeon]|nr:uracil phosphoribosyltransferase [Candidatus Woesearchaeota archaeon]